LNKHLGYELTKKEKEFIWETFKVKENIEDNPESIDERFVNLTTLVNMKKSGRQKKMNEIIEFEEREEKEAEDSKVKGLV